MLLSLVFSLAALLGEAPAIPMTQGEPLIPVKMIADEVLPFPQSARPAERQYQIKVRVFEKDQQGVERCLASPTLATLDGRPASFQTGGQIPLQSKDAESINMVQVGLQFTTTVKRTESGTLLVELTLNHSRNAKLQQTTRGRMLTMDTSNLQTTFAIRPGRTVDFEYESPTGAARPFRFEVTIDELTLQNGDYVKAYAND